MLASNPDPLQPLEGDLVLRQYGSLKSMQAFCSVFLSRSFGTGIWERMDSTHTQHTVHNFNLFYM